MIKEESCKVKEIDKKILEELRKKLQIRKENIDIMSKEEIKRIISKIEDKKKGIFLLFEGEFSINEQNIKERMPKNSIELSFYDKVANNIILKRVEEIFNRMMSLEPLNYRLISVCADRHFFIQRIISENVQTSVIESCINDIER